VGEWIIDAGGEVVVAGATRSEMFTAARQSGAVLGGGPSGRYWFACSAVPLADALCAVSLLLAILSKTDRPLSQVVRESIDGR
jgi:phosphomannomutase